MIKEAGPAVHGPNFARGMAQYHVGVEFIEEIHGEISHLLVHGPYGGLYVDMRLSDLELEGFALEILRELHERRKPRP